MNRRGFIAGVCVASVGAAANGRSQQKPMPVIGVLDSGDPAPLVEALREGLSRLGYVEGKNIRFQIRSATGRPELLRGLADELVARKVDLLVTRLTPAAQAAKAATHTIPIVMAPAGAPVETGLVASLARPGGTSRGSRWLPRR